MLTFIFCYFQAPEGENQPSTDVDLFVSAEKIMVLNTDLQVKKQIELYYDKCYLYVMVS